MESRSVINDKRKLVEGEWVLSLVRRKNTAHAYLILEGLENKEVTIRKRAELAFKETAPKKRDPLRTQIYYYDLTDDRLELMRRDQNDYLCKTFIITPEEKVRLDTKIEADQDREIPYNLGGHTKSSGFFGASLASAGPSESRASSIASAEKKVEGGSSSGYSLGHSSLATLRDGHNCLSWAEETVCYLNPKLDPRGGFAKYVIAVPQLELTSCVIL